MSEEVPGDANFALQTARPLTRLLPRKLTSSESRIQFKRGTILELRSPESQDLEVENGYYSVRALRFTLSSPYQVFIYVLVETCLQQRFLYIRINNRFIPYDYYIFDEA